MIEEKVQNSKNQAKKLDDLTKTIQKKFLFKVDEIDWSQK